MLRRWNWPLFCVESIYCQRCVQLAIWYCDVWNRSVATCQTCAHSFVAVCCRVLPRVAVCYSVLQCAALCCSVLHCVAVRCSVLQCVAVRCSVFQCVAACRMPAHSFVGIQILALSHERMMPLLHTCDVTPSYVRHASFICEMWLIHTWGMIYSLVRHASFIRVTCLIHMCVMTPSYVWHMWDTNHSYVWHDSFICITWLIRTCGWTVHMFCIILFSVNISETPHLRLLSHMATLWQVQI